jgi:inorganic pyrophosphatase
MESRIHTINPRCIGQIPEIDSEFWSFVDQLLKDGCCIVERPRGSRHPRYPDSIYPVDYGYVKDTHSTDGCEVDVWLGSQPGSPVQAVLCCVDLEKADAEIKLMVGCSPEEMDAATRFCNRGAMRSLLIRRGDRQDSEPQCASRAGFGV